MIRRLALVPMLGALAFLPVSCDFHNPGGQPVDPQPTATQPTAQPTSAQPTPLPTTPKPQPTPTTTQPTPIQPTAPATTGDSLETIAPVAGSWTLGDTNFIGKPIQGLLSPAGAASSQQSWDFTGWKSATGKVGLPDSGVTKTPVTVTFLLGDKAKTVELNDQVRWVNFDYRFAGSGWFTIKYDAKGQAPSGPAVVVFDTHVTR